MTPSALPESHTGIKRQAAHDDTYHHMTATSTAAAPRPQRASASAWLA